MAAPTCILPPHHHQTYDPIRFYSSEWMDLHLLFWHKEWVKASGCCIPPRKLHRSKPWGLCCSQRQILCSSEGYLLDPLSDSSLLWGCLGWWLGWPAGQQIVNDECLISFYSDTETDTLLCTDQVSASFSIDIPWVLHPSPWHIWNRKEAGSFPAGSLPALLVIFWQNKSADGLNYLVCKDEELSRGVCSKIFVPCPANQIGHNEENRKEGMMEGLRWCLKDRNGGVLMHLSFLLQFHSEWGADRNKKQLTRDFYQIVSLICSWLRSQR